MKADFWDATERHWEDAEMLHASQRLANADHLYGLAAECGFKAAMVTLGIHVDDWGSPTDSRHKVHVQKLWNEFQSFAAGSQIGRYATRLPPTNPFLDWRTDQRYAARSEFSSQKIANHRTGTELVRELLTQARLDGVL